MEAPVHSINNLFSQLGLALDDASIKLFIQTHRALVTNVVLSEAAFWPPAKS